MKTNELADIAGVDVSTIRRTAKKLFPDRTIRGKQSEFSEVESVQIMATVKKRNFVERNSVERNSVERNSALPERKNAFVDPSLVSTIVAETVKQLLPYIQYTAPLPAIAPVNYRSELNAIVRAYASKNSLLPGLAWTKFYQRVLYRLHINITTQAKNASMEVLDWAEENGYIEQLYQLAKEEF